MQAKTTVHLEKLLKLFPTIQSRFSSEVGRPLLEAILDVTSKGLSSVRGVGRFQGYSDSYREAILGGKFSKFEKYVRPVSLKLSGAMLASGTASEASKGKVRITFSDFKADIHNRRGAGKSKVVRHFLPTNSGETFTQAVLGKVTDALGRIISDEADKQNH